MSVLGDCSILSLGEIDAIVWKADAIRRRFSFVSKRAEEMLGYPLSAWLHEDDFWRRIVEPDDLGLAELYFQDASGGGGDHDHEYRVRDAADREVWVWDRVRVIPGDDGEPRLHGVTVEVTARRELAERLLQAQKIDAVGRLAGGVARDFDSLLAVIGGCTDLLLARTKDEASLGQLREIGRAAERAGELVAQLLAFGRRAPGHGELGDETALSVMTPTAKAAVEDDEQTEDFERAPLALVVEEDPAVRRLARSTLEQSGYRVHEAVNGREALEFLEQRSARVELLLSELAMPEVSGPELLAGLAPLGHATRVLFISGYADSQLLRSGLDDTAVGVVHKPFTPAELSERVAEVMAEELPLASD